MRADGMQVELGAPPLPHPTPPPAIKLDVWTVGISWEGKAGGCRACCPFPTKPPVDGPCLLFGGGHHSQSVMWWRATSAGLVNPTDLALNSGSAISLCVPLGQSFHLSKPQFPFSKNGDNNSRY